MSLPNIWIKREIESILCNPPESLRLFSVWLILGPRQVGKSSVLLRCGAGDRQYLNLDDLEVRARAHEDPVLFSRSLRTPLIIDEIQYAPQLLSSLKMLADERPLKPGAIWLTGSQNFDVMRGVHESLAGRVAILNLFGLTEFERSEPSGSPLDFFDRVLRSGFPALQETREQQTRTVYLNNYVRTYIERDVRELLGIEKRREFEVFVKLCANRVAQQVNYQQLARDAGVSSATAKSWYSVLEDSFILFSLAPWSSNLNSRLVKSSKLYFWDSGLASHFMGWRTADQLLHGPSSGPVFENAVISDLLRSLKHRAIPFSAWYFRTRDGIEIDLILEVGGRFCCIEVKKGSVKKQDLVSLKQNGLPPLERAWVVSLVATQGTETRLTEDWELVHPQDLVPEILKHFSFA